MRNCEPGKMLKPFHRCEDSVSVNGKVKRAKMKEILNKRSKKTRKERNTNGRIIK